jgi:hypothetical protein
LAIALAKEVARETGKSKRECLEEIVAVGELLRDRTNDSPKSCLPHGGALSGPVSEAPFLDIATDEEVREIGAAYLAWLAADNIWDAVQLGDKLAALLRDRWPKLLARLGRLSRFCYTQEVM